MNSEPLSCALLLKTMAALDLNGHKAPLDADGKVLVSSSAFPNQVNGLKKIMT